MNLGLTDGGLPAPSAVHDDLVDQKYQGVKAPAGGVRAAVEVKKVRKKIASARLVNTTGDQLQTTAGIFGFDTGHDAGVKVLFAQHIGGYKTSHHIGMGQQRGVGLLARLDAQCNQGVLVALHGNQALDGRFGRIKTFKRRRFAVRLGQQTGAGT